MPRRRGCTGGERERPQPLGVRRGRCMANIAQSMQQLGACSSGAGRGWHGTSPHLVVAHPDQWRGGASVPGDMRGTDTERALAAPCIAEGGEWVGVGGAGDPVSW